MSEFRRSIPYLALLCLIAGLALVAGTGCPHTPDSKPVPPAPVDPLYTDLKALYDNTADPKKAEYVKNLAVVYRLGVKMADNPDLKTSADLQAALQKERASRIPDDNAIFSIRERISQELRTLLPVSPVANLDAETRKIAKDGFTRIATVLERLQ